MKNNNENFIIKENFSNSDECLHYFLNMFGKLDVAFKSERIRRSSYRKAYKFLHNSLFANLKILSLRSKENRTLEKKELKVQVKEELKKISSISSNDIKQIEDSK